MPARTVTKAFPTAVGAGAGALGGTGGTVLHVTNLLWNTSPGSLLWALQQTYPRIIVFDVSGEIDARSQADYSLIINGASYDNVTIAGQTAPNGGITIRTSAFIFQNVDNIVCRYIRFRGGAGGSDQDSLWMLNCNNIIFDHCTFSHGNDEAASFSGSSGTMTNVTIQNCFFQDSKTGTILGVDGAYGEYTFINNLYSGVSHRFPNTKGIGRYDIVNNVVYNWKSRLCRFQEGGAQNLINNYYKPSYGGLRQPGWFGDGATTINQHKIAVNSDDTIAITNYPLVYTTGCEIEVERETPQTDDSDTFTAFFGSTAAAEYDPVPAKYFTSTQHTFVGESFSVKTAAQAYIDVLADVGANKTLNADGTINSYQDTKDAADITMIQNDTYSGAFYDSIASVPYPTVPSNSRPGGYYSSDPDIPETWYATNVTPGDTSSDLAPSGYTWMEEFLNQIDAPITGNIPVITLLGNSVINHTQFTIFTDPGVVASDNEDGDITGSVIVGGDTVDTNTIGTYVITYNVTDSDLNTAAQVTRTVNVVAPTISENIFQGNQKRIKVGNNLIKAYLGSNKL